MKTKFSKVLLRCSAILIFCLTLNSYAQDTGTKRQELDSLTKVMFEHTNNKNYDALIDITHPKLFEIVPKETMVTVLKSMLEGNEEMSIDIPEQHPEYKISDVFKDEENNSDFAFVSYALHMSMTFKNQEFDEDTKNSMVQMMKLQGMEAEFVSDSTISLNMPNSMTIMINDESTNNKWAMINYDPDSPMFFQILSAPVLEKAKSYYQDLMIAHKKKE
ncbi:hypothetical protein [Winogradskyella sp.]|uniref:hypothetical protein n=1 Tax=Winogradskyella sp. TaxID=1883156 RepID=UPI003BAC6FC5